MPEGSINRISPIEVSKELALDRCRFLANVQVWPLHSRLDPDRWLTNFTEDEMPYAVQMLHSFLYFSEPMVDQLLTAAFQGLSRVGIPLDGDLDVTQKKWNELKTNAIVTWVTGEVPSEADSGHVFIRKARQVLGIREGNLLSPADALNRLVKIGPRPVVFVDDFVGSGEQCVKTWSRILPGGAISFEQLAADPRYCFYYTPLICTQKGYQRLARECKGLVLNPAHVIPENYSLLAPDSVFWPDSLRERAADVIGKASARAGIPDWQGFGGLALGLAFFHSVPDATLPIFYWEQNRWKPLVRMT